MNKNNTISSVLIMLVFLAFILGCRGLAARRPTNYFEQNNIQTAAEAIKNKIGVPFKVFKVEVEKDKFTMQIQSPQNADNLDEYQYSGDLVAGPHPIHTDTFYDFRRFVFDFDDKDFASLSPMMQAAIAKSQLEDAEINRLTLGRGVGTGSDSQISGWQLYSVRWFMAIRGSRGDTTAVADERGNLQGVDLSKTSGAKNYDVLQPDELKKAVEAIKKSVGDEKKIYKISFTREAMGAEILNAQNDLEGYRFTISGFNRAGITPGMFKTPTNELFSLADLDLSAAANLVQKAIERLKLKNGTLDNIKIECTNAFDPQSKFRIVWKVSIKGYSGKGVVEFEAQGKETSARRYDSNGKDDENFK